jgi:iron(III) transport system substrate-binding protein
MTVREKVVVYSAAEEQYCEALLAGFAERHPGLEVDFRFGISTALHERYLASVAAGAPEADLLWSSAMDLQMALVARGEALPWSSAEAGALPASAVYRDLAYATTLEPLATLVNRAQLGATPIAGSLPEIATLLASEPGRYQGRIAAFDIERNGLGFLALLAECGNAHDCERFMQALGVCAPRLFPSNPALVDEVACGRAVLGYHLLESYAARAVKAHASLAIAASGAPPLAVSRIAFISRRAPHPGAAGLFLDYLLSREGQQQLAEGGFPPIRMDLPAQFARAIPIDGGLEDLRDAQRREGMLQRWRAAVGRSSALTRDTGT